MFAAPYFIKYLHNYIHSIIVQYTYISEIHIFNPLLLLSWPFFS